MTSRCMATLSENDGCHHCMTPIIHPRRTSRDDNATDTSFKNSVENNRGVSQLCRPISRFAMVMFDEIRPNPNRINARWLLDQQYLLHSVCRDTELPFCLDSLLKRQGSAVRCDTQTGFFGRHFLAQSRRFR